MGAVKEWLNNCRESRKLILFIVAIALLLDNMLLTTVVPIIPKYLYLIRHPNATAPSPPTTKPTPPENVTTVLPAYLVNTNNGCQPCVCGGEKPELVTEPPPPPTKPSCSPGTPPAEPGNDPGKPPPTTEFLTRTERPPDLPSSTTTAPLRGSELLGMNHDDLVSENVEVGLLFCSKAVVQLITNPIIGPLTHRLVALRFCLRVLGEWECMCVCVCGALFARVNARVVAWNKKVYHVFGIENISRFDIPTVVYVFQFSLHKPELCRL
ncbi:synaptic vesicular amine transporter-like [Penaeus japonicus]|uniref:synaptic vesicular amine transporter-like n=1 Tax=Penaeus japonicus TaxID=27405 RepID=UPI001C7124ED|nr:synaptic vesicular amine transporter-like [Penaeus japonicus]